MALSDLTFKLYSDTGLTSLFGGTLTLVHKSDFSDNPQDFVLYFGSTTANRKLQAASNPGVDQITLTPTYAIPVWTTATALALGVSRRPTAPTGYRYQVTTAGTTHASTQPTWPTVIGSTVSDGTVVWTCVAEERDVNEITLALSSGDLDTNVAGAALDIGTQVLSGTSNDIAIHIRVENAIPTLSSTIGQAELTINIESVIEGVV
jgi:hypothetical protein